VSVQHGKNVRSPQLQQNTRYVMKTWGKTPSWEEVLFVHFLRAGNQTYKQPTVQLKDMLPTDFYIFKQADGSELRGKMKDLCLVRADTEARITFAEVLKQSTAIPAAAPAPVVAAPVEEIAEEAEQVAETAAEEPVEAAANVADESPVADVNEEMLLGDADETLTDTVEAAEAAPEGESKEDRKRRLDRERKAEKRRQAKEAFTALVTAPGDDAAQAAA
jgi:hypothetical protein